MRLLLQYPEISSKLCEVLVNKLNQTINLDDIDVIISPAIGGITLGHDVARITGKSIFSWKKKKDY